MSQFAALDLGSNTVRLLLAERGDPDGFSTRRIERRITRLAGGFSPGGNLNEEAADRTLRALAEFADLLVREGVERTFAVATGVLREAMNGRAFLERVRAQTGLEIRLLSAAEEARLMLRGALRPLSEKIPRQIVADIGGFSTEILWVEDGELREIRSIRLGAVGLVEVHLAGDPPTALELGALFARIRPVLWRVRQSFEGRGMSREGLNPSLLGTAGTATTLAVIDLRLAAYDPGRINGHLLSRPRLEEIFEHLRSLPLAERRMVPGLEKGREDLILAGTAVVLGLLEVFGLAGLRVVDSGLLEGVLLDGLDRLHS
ncbi:MAG: exopolyphosphatase [Deltaproteobacteria bacterium]|nr:exopolyphosphatase [Deltaproteobacteria bacterium]